VRQRPVSPVGEDLFGLGVAAVLLLRLDQGERGVGEHGVVAPDGEQLVLAPGGRRVEVFDPADDQPSGDGLPLLRGERGIADLGDLGVEDPAAQLVTSQTARAYLMGVQAPSPICAIAAFTFGSIGTVTEKNAPARRTAPVNAAE
jgi:hypothetical protein